MARNRLQFVVGVKDDASANLQRISKETDSLTSSFGRLASAAAAIATLGKIGKVADTYRLLQNRLKLVTSGTEELKAVTEELTAVAFRSRTSFQSTADLYARVARSTRTLGLSQQELIDFTETVSKSITISGSTAQEAAAGVIQFGQALASSRLSGDELRSVLEQMPRLAQAIADGLGTTIGRLREMGEAGELTTRKVLGALQKSAPAIEREFAQLAPLLSQGFTLLEAAATVAIGKLDDVTQTSRILAEVLIGVSEDVVIMANAFTGSLEPADKLGRKMSILATTILTVATTFNVLGQAMSFGLGSSGDIFAESVVAMNSKIRAVFDNFKLLLEPGDDQGHLMAELEAIENVFLERVGNIFTGDRFERALAEAQLTVTDFMEKLGQIGGTFAREESGGFDLSAKGTAADEQTRKQREATAKALNGLKRMQESLRQSIAAFKLAATSGIDYAEALARIKAITLGVDSGQRQLARSVLGQIDEQARLKAAVEAREQAAKDAADALAESLRFQENLARRAAENIFDAFAEFLFDPFEDGIKGMLESFLTALRTMLAQAVAFKILSSIPGLGDFFSKVGGRAAGGPVTAGMPVLVGERGPELFIPNASGTIANNSATKARGGASGATFVTHIDARGADPSLIARLPAIMEQRDKMLMLKMKDFIETGSILI